MVDDADGAAAVRLARASATEAVAHPARRDAAEPFRSTRLPALFETPRGVFVTLTRWPDGRLRGCIGYTAPVYPLRTAIPRVAAAAALEDPRFPPVRAPELGAVAIEVSLLTIPEPLPGGDADARQAAVRIGRDGLIVDRNGASGLLLPQVAPEQGWDARELLEGTCEKAGLPRDAWRSMETRLRRFEAEIFAEVSPDGPIRRRPPPAPLR